MREQRILEEGLGVVDLSNREVITVTGPDRLSWLHSLTTQHLLGLARPRESREALILSPKGHVEHSLHLVDDGETTWITTEPGAGQPARVARANALHAARRGRRRHRGLGGPRRAARLESVAGRAPRVA